MDFSRPYTAQEIAQLTNANIIGNEQNSFSGINEIHRIQPGEIVFVDHPKYYKKALQSSATGILINTSAEVCPARKTLFVVADPFRSFVELAQLFKPFTASERAISETAKIHPSAIIQPNVFIGNNVTVGENTVIHSGVSIYDGCTIGNHVIIHANSSIGADAFYYKNRGSHFEKLHSCGSVIIEDQVEIGALCSIDKGVSSNTIIGKGTKIDAQVHIGHDTTIGENCLIAAHVGIAGCVQIHEKVTIWGQVGVKSDVTLGAGCIVLAQSGVGMDLEPGKTYFGSPCIEARAKMKEIAAIKHLTQKM